MASIPRFPANSTSVTTASTTTRPTTTSIRRTKPFFDLGYVRTFGGIIKLVQLILDILTLICLIVGPVPDWTDVRWAEFVAITALVVTLVLFIIYVFHVDEMAPVVPWILLDMAYCLIWVVFYAIASGLMAYRSTKWRECEAYGAAAFFGFMAMAVYGFDGVMKCVGWLRGHITTRRSSPTTAVGGGRA